MTTANVLAALDYYTLWDNHPPIQNVYPPLFGKQGVGI
jgi:hypothetical protein